MALKVDDCLVAALCPTCHAEIDQGGILTRAERRERLDKAILKTLVELCRQGKVKAV
jgi:ferredoxin